MSRRASSRLFTLLTSPPCTRSIVPSHRHPQFRAFTTQPPRLTQPPPQTPPPNEARTNAAHVSYELSSSSESQPLRDLSAGLSDPLPTIATNNASESENGSQVDWARSFHGLSSTPFTPEQATVLQQTIEPDDIEVKPDGIIYLPEIKYRRILNKAFGPGGWGLAPRGETIVTGKIVTREYGLVCGGRLVSVARGEQQYFDPDGIPTATEGCKSNALMRCCKDLGVASELWDPRFVRRFLGEMAREIMVEHAVTKKRRKYWLRKEDEVRYPFKEVSSSSSSSTGASTAATNGNSSYRTTTTSSSSRSSMARKPGAQAAEKK